MAITKVTEGVRTLGTGEVATANMATDPTNASNLSSGSVPTAQLGNVDNSAVLNDIATLALHSAVQNNQAAYNLSNAFIDQYEDSTGIDALSDAERSTSEYMWAATTSTGAFTSDSDTIALLHFDGADDGTTFTDSSSNSLTINVVGNTVTKTGTKKFGTASAYFPATGSPGNYLKIAANSVLGPTTGAATMECWVNSTFTTHCALWDFRVDTNNNLFMDWAVSGDPDVMRYELAPTIREFATPDADDGNWHHTAVVRDNANSSWYFYYDGVSLSPSSGTMDYLMTTAWNTGPEALIIANNYPFSAQWQGYMDELRYSSVARYPGGTTFTPNQTTVISATGNYTSASQTANATVSKMSIVVLYKNNAGTATLDTDLVAQVSSNGGTNYTSAPLTAAGTFSTGILMAKSNDITISNTGTAPKYKISFANQVASSKETYVYGVALLY